MLPSEDDWHLKHVQYSHIYMQIANKTHWTFLNVPKSYVFSHCHELCDPGVVHWITAELIIFYHPMFISVWHRGETRILRSLMLQWPIIFILKKIINFFMTESPCFLYLYLTSEKEIELYAIIIGLSSRAFPTNNLHV